MKKNQSLFSPARTNPELSRRLKLPDFKTIGIKRWQISWYLYLLEAESTPES